MNIRAVISRNPILFPMAGAAALTVVLIGESSYWQSGTLLNELSALRAGTVSLEELRATATDGQANIHRTLLFNRLGVALLSAASLAALFLYLRQSLALEEQHHGQCRGAGHGEQDGVAGNDRADVHQQSRHRLRRCSDAASADERRHRPLPECRLSVAGHLMVRGERGHEVVTQPWRRSRARCWRQTGQGRVLRHRSGH
jgi:hypothetical protein